MPLWGADMNKLKPNLKMAVHRIQIHKNKRTALNKQNTREIAQLLGDGKVEKARIKVEGVINDDFKIEGLEILSLLCELCSERADLIKAERNCPYDMREAVSTLIWAASRSGIPELLEVKKQFTKKYGSEFAAAAMSNADKCVNERVMQKLSVQPPSAFLVQNYLKEIASVHGVEFDIEEDDEFDPMAPMQAPIGTDAREAPTTGFTRAYVPPPGKIPSPFPDIPSTEPGSIHSSTGTSAASSSIIGGSSEEMPRSDSASTLHSTSAPEINEFSEDRVAPSKDDDVPEFDEMMARFQRLRKNLNDT